MFKYSIKTNILTTFLVLMGTVSVLILASQYYFNKELSNMPKELRLKLYELYDIVELEMKNYYKPTKMNLASFANMLPRVHLHVMARYENDSYFPNPMWGEKLRDSNLELPNEEDFHKKLLSQLEGF